MEPEIIWLRIASMIVIYMASKIADPYRNSFLRMFEVIPLGVLAGHGFWSTWQMINGKIVLSTLNNGQLALYVLTMAGVVYVLLSMWILVIRLFQK